jgi:hypothetical protein
MVVIIYNQNIHDYVLLRYDWYCTVSDRAVLTTYWPVVKVMVSFLLQLPASSKSGRDMTGALIVVKWC